MKNNLELNTSNHLKALKKTTLKQSLNAHLKYIIKDPQYILNRESFLLEILSSFLTIGKNQKNIEELCKCFNRYVDKLGYEFSGICLPDKINGALEVKTYNKTLEANAFSFSLYDNDNILTRSFQDKSGKFVGSRELASINCPDMEEFIVIPLTLHGECYGVVTAGSTFRDRAKDEVLNNLCNCFSLFLANHNLANDLNSFCDFDNLTGLYSHRKFQEALSENIIKAEANNQKLSVAIFDITDFSRINREFGHSHGDEVLLAFANLLKASLRGKDLAGRYGGDEIAVILPNTDNEEALLITQKIISEISNQNFEKIGIITASVGLSTYPTLADDKEKLLNMAKQSAISQPDKELITGKPFVVTSGNINFWNKIALDSLSKVISKKNPSHRYSFEDELVSQLQKESQLSEITMEVVSSLAAAIDAKDTYTKGHSQSVSVFAEGLANAVGLDKHHVARIKVAAILHDVGKIGISETILRKPGPLTDHEWEVMKQHPIIGVKKILEPVKSLNDLIPFVRHHHERIDGFGYPDRLKGDEIPIGSRIIAIADSFHALISSRPYRKAVDTTRATEVLRSGAGSQWDKDLVETFIANLYEFFIAQA